MALGLRLFSVFKSAEEIEADEAMSPTSYRATAHVAWGAYNWLSLMAQYYGIDPPTYSPYFQIPGEPRDMYRPSAIPSPPLPSYMGRTFTAMCQLRRIHTKAILAYNTRGAVPILNRVSLQFTEDIFKEMLAWADTLGTDQLRREYAEGHVLILQ
jgi:hypothetical protein